MPWMADSDDHVVASCVLAVAVAEVGYDAYVVAIVLTATVAVEAPMVVRVAVGGGTPLDQENIPTAAGLVELVVEAVAVEEPTTCVL